MSDGVLQAPAPSGSRTPDESTDIVLPAPPAMPEDDQAGGAWTAALPMLGGLGTVAMVTGVGGAAQGVRGYLVGALFLLSSCALVVVQLLRQHAHRARRVQEQRRGYLHLVAQSRPSVRRLAQQQRAQALRAHPGVRDLLHLRGTAPRTEVEAEILGLRLGLGLAPLRARLRVTDPPSGVVVDPVCARAARRFVTTHAHLDEMPVVLPGGSHLLLTGDPEQCLETARALVVQAAGAHDPTTLAVAVLSPRTCRVDWEWVKWLPHAGAYPGVPRGADALGPRRLLDDDPRVLGGLVADDPRHHLLVVDASRVPAWASGSRTTVLRLRPDPDGSTGTGSRLDVERGLLHTPTGTIACVPDVCDLSTVEAVARSTARGSACLASAGTSRERTFLTLLGTASPDVLPAAHPAAPRGAHLRMRAPLGHTDDGQPVHLDLKEAAEGGSGPHGLVVGATGSGKSELLRTLVLGLAATHSPDEVAMVLVDFKGGATFAEFENLPHVAGFVTNLADDLALVARMQDALGGELTRRQELLRAAGCASLSEHRAARAADQALPAVPSLFVCVDEFSELLSARPEFIDLFVAIGRLGRSLGIHLLLATQRLEEGRLRGLESHLSYRVALRTFSASESRQAIGVPDAHTLPAGPGAGLLRTGPDALVRFRAAHVSGPWPGTGDERSAHQGRVLPFTVTPVQHPAGYAPPLSAAMESATSSESVLVRLTRASHRGARTHQVWQPPLTHPVTLGDVVGELVLDPRLGLHSPGGRVGHGLRLAVGLVDRPRLQRREPLVLDLSGAGGHVAVVGGPRSGRSTALQTYVASLALAATPLEAQVHLLDLAGGALAPLSALPHVVGHARRGEDDLVRRVVDEVCDLVDRRERHFREHGIDSVAQYRALLRTGTASDGFGDVHLVVDGWSILRAEHEESEADLTRLATRALTFGVHLVIASHRWSDLRPTLRDLVASRVELRLTDAYDSEVDRRRAAEVPASLPGRGLVPGPEHVRVASPRIDGTADPASARDGLADLVERVATSWAGPVPRRLRPLPERVALDQLDAPPCAAAYVPTHAAADAAGHTGLPLALAEQTQEPFTVDVRRHPHLVVRGDQGSGRTETLRTYLASLQVHRDPGQAQVVVVDPRRRLVGAVDEPHLLAHVSDPSETNALVREVAASLSRRSGPAASAGAEVFVVVDDAELVVDPQGGSPLDPLAGLLPLASDLGLRVVLARRRRGHLLPDRVSRALDDLAAPVLTLTGTVPGRATWQHGDARPTRVQVALSGAGGRT